LNLQVTAEGVETPEQLAWLLDLGCDLGQGYYFSKPLSSESAEARLFTHFLM
jgi:EAL domain-containing protein (putative c-di-GMP-specific phosphodiesterase class I)